MAKRRRKVLCADESQSQQVTQEQASYPVFKLVGPEQDSDEEDVSTAALPLEQAERLRLARRPDITKLRDAVEKLPGGFVRCLFKPGDEIIVERRTALFPGSPWLDTRRLRVVGVDEFSGTIRCEDEARCRAASFVKLSSPLQVIKLAPKRKRGSDL